MVSPLFDWMNMEKYHTLEHAFRNLRGDMKKEYTLREAFVDFIIQYKELSMELQDARLHYGKLMDVICSKDNLIAESMDTISKMNKKIKDDQRYINILIEKLCIHGNFDREYLESLRDAVEDADQDQAMEEKK